jgi:hypothetical protein
MIEYIGEREKDDRIYMGYKKKKKKGPTATHP